MLVLVDIFFYKQKTAYEMRISDWSSDVCSSDLAEPAALDAETIVAEPQSREIRSIFEIHRQSDAMARLASDARLAEVARFLLGDRVYIHQSRLNYKPGFKGKEFYWHSDFETWHVRSEERRVGNDGGSKCRFRCGPYH